MAAARPPFRFRPARLRFPAQHRFFEEGDVHRHLRLQELLRDGPEEEEEEQRQRQEGGPCSAREPLVCQAAGCRQAFASLRSYEQHYEARHRESCSACGRAFPSAHLLGLHLLEDHQDALFLAAARRQQPVYQCLVESCSEKFKNSRDRKDHVVRVHQYPSDFRFDKPVKDPSRAKPRRPPPREGVVPMEVRTEASEQGPGEAMETSCMEDTGQPARESALALPGSQRRLYLPRIPPTICFGQGAPRGFRGRPKDT